MQTSLIVNYGLNMQNNVKHQHKSRPHLTTCCSMPNFL